MKAACAGKLDSLPELLSGKFPKTLGEVFTAQGRGLFPSPQEIDFDCSCPDWADMCKHVAATLYGIGTRLDDDAGLFFKLRRVKIDDLIQQTLKEQSYKLLEKAGTMSSGKIAESDLSGMFGIDMEEPMDLDLPKTTKKARAKAPIKKSAAKRKTTELTDTAQILTIIKRSKRGLNVATLRQKTGFDEKKIRNVIYKAFRQGIIKRAGRGIYLGA
jgi:uncharacterized Zn finger protein